MGTATIVSQPDQYGRITVTTNKHRIEVHPRSDYEPRATAVYVDDDIASTVDHELAELNAQEAGLGKRRFSTRGEHPDVDDLYDRLNRRIADTKLAIAREALTSLGGVVDGDLSTEALDRTFFSPRAGCDMCACSPGVVIPLSLAMEGTRADIWIRPLNENR